MLAQVNTINLPVVPLTPSRSRAGERATEIVNETFLFTFALSPFAYLRTPA